MVGVVLASHGEFAKGILQSSTMVFGEQEDVKAVTLMPNEGPADIKAKMEDVVASFSSQDEVLFLIDLWGGTPFNQASTLLKGHEDKWAIVTGLNLPMVIEAYGARLSMDSAQAIASSILTVAREGIKALPEKLEPAPAENAAKAPVQQSNLGAPGSFKYVLARIDSRLLHGQVATGWSKAVNPTRIIVVSDAVAKDKLRSNLIKQAAPPGIKAHVVSIQHMAELAKDNQHFGGQRALLLFETPQDVLRAVEGGVPLKTINVGSMAHSIGKVQPNRTLAFNQDDIDTFRKLKQAGLTFDVRKVPGDLKGNMDEILKKAQEELNKLKQS